MIKTFGSVDKTFFYFLEMKEWGIRYLVLQDLAKKKIAAKL